MPRSRLLLLVLIALAPRPGLAAEPLAYDLSIDLPIIAVTGGAWLFSETVLKQQLAPAQCRWCDSNGSGENTLNAFDSAGRSLRWKSPGTADLISGIDAFAVVPIAMLGLDALGSSHNGVLRDWAEDAMILVESVTLQAALTQYVKFTVGRQRPWVHFLPAAERNQVSNPDDSNVSFYSGHTSLAFALVVTAGVLAHERGYDVEAVIWAVGLPLAATVGYLRMAADEHYATDVIAGAVVGSAIGFLVPVVLHPRTSLGPVSVAVGPNGVAVTVPLP
jgi:membrane-associated phospholipid phosphatase